MSRNMTGLHQLFAQNESDLQRAMERARATFEHHGERGSKVEQEVRKFLSMHLPRRYSVAHGEIIDLAGNRSRQSDCVILNEDQPLGLSGDVENAGVFLVEGVSAVGEIKAVLTKSSLSDAIEKGVHLRRLRATETEGAEVMAAHSDAVRFGSSPPYFLLAFQASIAEETFADLLRAVPLVDPAPGGTTIGDAVALPAIDAIFTLDQNRAVVHTWNNEGSLVASGPSSSPWVTFQSATPLTAFLLWLYATMPHIIRRIPPALQYFRQLYGT